jgi:hypothetical protein
MVDGFSEALPPDLHGVSVEVQVRKEDALIPRASITTPVDGVVVAVKAEYIFAQMSAPENTLAST